jgi:putative peptidoglycan lipid II flippase
MVKRVFTFMYKEVRGLHQAAYILALFAVGSQVLAIIRDRLLAHTFGADAELDLYYAAFRVPDLLFVLFASVLSIYVLLPFVHRHAEIGGESAGARVLSQAFTLFLWGYVVVAGVLALTAPLYVPYLFPGFVGDYEILTVMLQVLLLQPFLLGLSSLCGVVTQMNHRFILYALSPLLYNVGIIFGIIVFYPAIGLLGLAFGVVLGAIGHVLVQVPFIMRSPYAFTLVPKIDWQLMRQIFVVSVPRALTLSSNQIVLLVLIGMASVMAAGSVSVFQFAFNLQSVPLAIIGVSYSVAAFPTLSNLFAQKDQIGFNRQLLTALRHIIFWSVPIIGLIIVLRAQIVRVLLGSGEFDWSDTRLTAAMLAIFVVSMVAQAILLLLIRAYYAGGKTLLPLLVAVGSGIVSIVLAFVLRDLYHELPALQAYLNDLLRLKDVFGAEVLVLALAFIVGQFLQLIILLMLSVRTFAISYRPLVWLCTEAMLAAFAGGLAAYVTLEFLVEGINQETFVGIFIQGVAAGVMGIIAIILTYLVTGAPELREIYRSFQTKLSKTEIIAPQEEQTRD